MMARWIGDLRLGITDCRLALSEAEITDGGDSIGCSGIPPFGGTIGLAHSWDWV
ncbi:MAG: hypothetical protein HY707_05200 [Ignavibacteriae bacterium]|nr:hypothetical protein [Ignavibacteriota bacterium]